MQNPFVQSMFQIAQEDDFISSVAKNFFKLQENKIACNTDGLCNISRL